MSFSSSEDEFESWCESFVETSNDPLISQSRGSTSTQESISNASSLSDTLLNDPTYNNRPRGANIRQPELSSATPVVAISTDRVSSRSLQANNTTQSSSTRNSRSLRNASGIPANSSNTTGTNISTTPAINSSSNTANANSRTALKRRAEGNQLRSSSNTCNLTRVYQGVSDSEEDDDDDEQARTQLQSILNDPSLGKQNKEKPEDEDFKGLGAVECPICFDSPKYVCALPCGHLYCSNCINKVVAYQHKCSICRKTVKSKDIKFLQFKIKA